MRSRLGGRTMRLIEFADARLCLFILAMVVLILGVRGAVVRAANPTGLMIVSWKNSKTGDADQVFLVEPGDTITFTVTTNEICNFTWEVMLAAKVLQAYEENNKKTSSFTWQVPNETSTWSIDVACMRRRTVVGPPERAVLSWTITTANLIEVNEGEDIQSAIDSLPDEGGIVELKEGTWNITSPIRIRNDNITLVGQGIDKTIIDQVTPQTDAIVIGKFDGAHDRSAWLYHNNIKSGVLLDWFKDHPEEIIQNVRVQKMTVNIKDTPEDVIFGGICTVEAINLGVSQIKGTANPHNNDSRAVSITHSVDVTVKDCILSGYGHPLCPFLASHRVRVVYNTISNVKGWNSIEYNGAWPLRADWKPEDGYTPGDIDTVHPGSLIKGNLIYNGGQGIYVYSSYGVTVTENAVIESGGNCEGIRLNNCGDKMVVSKNIVSGCSSAGLGIRTYTYMHCKAEVFNNIFSKSKFYSSGRLAGHGIAITSSQHGKNTIHIYSNTIVDNEGDGIYNPEGWPVTVKNNIIVNNKGAGIRQGTNISYNDVWNNTGGNYVDCSPGDNDISTDPLFVDPDNGDFHLKSEYGRWNGSAWVKDDVTSPCIDAGDPSSDYSNEPDYPNGRINMGAYGNTAEASLGEGVDVTPPEITLKTFTINGSVDDDTVTEVEINGVPVPVTAGKYSYEVDVSSTKTITITATNDKGETVTRTIEVK